MEVQRALKGTDATSRIRVKFSAAAATAPWYPPAITALNDAFQPPSGPGGAGAGSSGQQGVCEVPVAPPLPLSDLPCVRWARRVPRLAAAALLQGSQHTLIPPAADGDDADGAGPSTQATQATVQTVQTVQTQAFARFNSSSQGTGAGLGAAGGGGGSGEVEVFVPLVLLVLSPEEFTRHIRVRLPPACT